MTLPDWVESVKGLVGGLLAQPIRASRRARAAAAALALPFAASVAEMFKLRVARPLHELAESKMQKVRSQDIADATKAHNEALAVRLKAESEAEERRANAEKTRAEARAIDERSAIERGRFELERMERERQTARQNLEVKRERLARALVELKRKGGDIYLPDPEDDDDKPALGEGSG